MAEEKPVRNQDGLPEKMQEKIKSSAGLNPTGAPSTGLNASRIWEGVPKFIQSKCETVYPGNPSRTNAQIVIGRDRQDAIPTGEGGKGHTQCGSIDLVAGRSAADPQTSLYVNPNFESDAARIYISQRTNIDQYFGLKAGNVGLSKQKSAIGMKADSVRIISREGIKLVTMPARTKMSMGTKTKTFYGIDLNAGNQGDDEDPRAPYSSEEPRRALQPIPLGDNLVYSLKQILKLINDTNTRLDSLAKNQYLINALVTSHIHVTPIGPAGIPTLPSPSLAAGCVNPSIKIFSDVIMKSYPASMNEAAVRLNYFTSDGQYYILSRQNRTT